MHIMTFGGPQAVANLNPSAQFAARRLTLDICPEPGAQLGGAAGAQSAATAEGS